MSKEEIKCVRCKNINPDPTYKTCPDCRAYMRYHNRKHRAKLARQNRCIKCGQSLEHQSKHTRCGKCLGKQRVDAPEVLKAPWPHEGLPEPGLRCIPTERMGWFELV